MAPRLVCKAHKVISGITGPDHFMPNTKWTAIRIICVAFVMDYREAYLFRDMPHAND